MKIARTAIRLRSRGGAIAHDLMMIPVAWLGAFWLRFNLDSVPADFLGQALGLLPMIVAIQGLAFLYFGLYRGVWRFASLPDLVRIIRAVAVGVILCAVAVFFMTRMVHVPRVSFPLFAILLTVLLCGPRLAYRWVKDRWPGEDLKAVLIVGAGRTGERLAYSLLHDPVRRYRPVGFVDDDPGKKGRDIHGVRVLGHCGQVPEVAAHTGADLIAISTPSASTAQMRRLVECCGRSHLPIQTMSRERNFVSALAAPCELRDIAIEDLLNRETAKIDWPGMRNELAARTVLVTGGGGSIGSELCRQIAQLAPSHLVIADISEFNLYRIHIELSAACPDLSFSIMLADICDSAAVEHIFERHSPEIVFHAAAYKHVPMLESHLREAVRVNVLGTHTVAHTAARRGVRRFVLVSSDKAVNPANAMGASKRLAEKVCHAVHDASPTIRFMVVRFGNVLDSAGSVVPLFREQIARGGPVTVTDREMRRYFMTIPEACQLVIASATLGEGGEVFVLDMGEPMRIVHLAELMIRLSGKVPGKDVAIEFIGPRPGEKLSEELCLPTESLGPTRHEKILLARPRPVERTLFKERLAELRKACDAFDEPALERILAGLVPEYLREPLLPSEDVIPIARAKR